MSTQILSGEEKCLNNIDNTSKSISKTNQHRVRYGTFTSSSVSNSIAAGYIAAVSGVMVGHPLDSAKVWIQTNTKIKNRHLRLPRTSFKSSNAPKAKTGEFVRSVTTAASKVTTKRNQTQNLWSYSNREVWVSSTRKLRALYSGVTGPLLTTGILQCINFAIYDSVRRILYLQDNQYVNEVDYLCSDSLTNVAIAGFTASSTLILFTGTLIKIKLNQQITGNGLRKAIYDTFRPNGSTSLGRLSSGLGVHFVTEALFRSTYYTTYEGLKRSKMWRTHDTNSPITLQERMASAAIAGATSWSAIFPLDAIRSRMVAQSRDTRKTCLEIISAMYYESGPSGSLKSFYRGFGLAVFRGGLVAAVVLPVYDLSLNWISS